MKLSKMAKILVTYADALHAAGNGDGARRIERLAEAMKKNGKLEVGFLRNALSPKDL